MAALAEQQRAPLQERRDKVPYWGLIRASGLGFYKGLRKQLMIHIGFWV